MEKVQAALIVSTDQAIRKRFASLFSKAGIPHILESSHTKALLRILDMSIKLGIISIEENTKKDTDFLKVIRIIRPRLSLIAVIDETMIESHRKLLDAGANYCFVKTSRESEIQKIVKEILSEKQSA